MVQVTTPNWDQTATLLSQCVCARRPAAVSSYTTVLSARLKRGPDSLGWRLWPSRMDASSPRKDWRGLGGGQRAGVGGRLEQVAVVVSGGRA